MDPKPLRRPLEDYLQEEFEADEAVAEAQPTPVVQLNLRPEDLEARK